MIVPTPECLSVRRREISVIAVKQTNESLRRCSSQILWINSFINLKNWCDIENLPTNTTGAKNTNCVDVRVRSHDTSSIQIDLFHRLYRQTSVFPLAAIWRLDDHYLGPATKWIGHSVQPQYIPVVSCPAPQFLRMVVETVGLGTTPIPRHFPKKKNIYTMCMENRKTPAHFITAT